MSFLLSMVLTMIRAMGRIRARPIINTITSSYEGPSDWKSKILVYTKEVYNFNFLTSKYLCKERATPHLRSVNIRRQPQTRNDVYGRIGIVNVELDKSAEM